MSTVSRTSSGSQKLPYDVFYILVEEGHLRDEEGFIGRGHFKDVCSLRLTCRSLAKILAPPLYRKDIRATMAQEMWWGDLSSEESDHDTEDYDPLPQPFYRPFHRWTDDPQSSGDDIEGDQSDSDGHSDSSEMGFKRDRNPTNYDMSTYIGKNRAHFNRTVVYPIKKTALHWAAENGYVEMLKVILRQATLIDPLYLDVKVRGAKTALALAAQNGHTEIVELLIKAGAFVDAPSPYSRNFTRRYKGARLRNNDPDHPSRRNERRPHFVTPLGLAIRFGKQDTAVLLARHTEHLNHHGWDKDRTIVSPLTLAVKKKMYGVIKLLLSRGYTDNDSPSIRHERECHPLCVAASIPNNEEMLGFLIDLGMSVDTKGSWGYNYPIEWAIDSGCLDNAFYLLGREEPDYVGNRIVRALWSSMQKDKYFEVTKAIAERLNSLGRFEIIQRRLWEIDHSRKRSKTLSFLANLMATGLNREYIREDQTYVHWLLEKSDSELGFEPSFGYDIENTLKYAKDTFDINAKNRDGHTGVELAILSGRETAREDLVYLGAIDPDPLPSPKD